MESPFYEMQQELEYFKRQSMRWISVKDRLPESDEDVLVFVQGPYDKGIEIASYNPNRRRAWDIDWLNATVTHWMPLPKPPTYEYML